MANSYNTQILRDGYRNFVIRVTGEIDLSVTPVVDIAPTQLTTIASLSPPCTALRVMKAQWSVPPGTPLDVQLWWQATSNELFWGAGSGDQGDFTTYGGLTNNASPGATGDIMFSTSGAAGATTVASGNWTFALILECVKQNAQYPT